MSYSKRTLTILAVLVTILLAAIAIPVSATPPEDVTIDVTSLYSFLDFTHPTGTWNSEGVIFSNGELLGVPVHFGAGWPHGKGFQTAHVVEVIGDENGSITISSQTKGYEFTYPADPIIDEHFEGAGRWVILSGTGDYANLHGRGTVTVEGDVDWDTLTMTTMAKYEGLAHFDP